MQYVFDKNMIFNTAKDSALSVSVFLYTFLFIIIFLKIFCNPISLLLICLCLLKVAKVLYLELYAISHQKISCYSKICLLIMATLEYYQEIWVYFIDAAFLAGSKLFITNCFKWNRDIFKMNYLMGKSCHKTISKTL